ncbi:MAG TPA: hypothetical protein VM427_03840 [Patescibacteria group bacterium]|nr:hypothetical protein [Patescibacteria group bacterium]
MSDRQTDPRELVLRLPIESVEELRALRGALLAARASELSEIQRRSQRHGLGYGTDSARESMTDEVASLRRRWTMLDRLLEAIESAEPRTPSTG